MITLYKKHGLRRNPPAYNQLPHELSPEQKTLVAVLERRFGEIPYSVMEEISDISDPNRLSKLRLEAQSADNLRELDI